jgi:hypothetical protein
MVGGGGQAEYARVPFADVGPLRIEPDLSDEQVLFLSDILPTGYLGAEMCDITDGDVLAVWGPGRSGSSRWTAPGARRRAGHRHRQRALPAGEGGRGPDTCLDAVRMEATYGYDLVKNEEDRCEKVVLRP